MKDFEKTKAFVESVNRFYFLVEELWDYKGQPLEPYFSKLRDLRVTTRYMGEQLVSEVKEICPSLKDLQWYFDEWSRLLDVIILHYKFVNISPSEWTYKLQDDQAALTLCGIIRSMYDNYQDVISAKRMLAEEFDLDTQESVELKREMKNVLNETKQNNPSFTNLIDPHHDKQKVLDRFHQLCDNQRPIDIGITIAIAVAEGILTREPRTKEFESEFSGVKYGSVYKHFHIYDTPGDEKKENHDKKIYNLIEGKHFFPQ